MAVRKIVSYVLTATLIVLAMDNIAPLAGFGLAGPLPLDGDVNPQIVDRTHKGDRLQFPAANDWRRAPSASPAMPVGCESVFSALSSGARANFAARCVS